MRSLARSLGRRERATQTGEPVWVSDVFPELRGVSIPNHSGDMKIGTKNSVLSVLELDVELHEQFEWEDSGDDTM